MLSVGMTANANVQNAFSRAGCAYSGGIPDLFWYIKGPLTKYIIILV